MSGNTECSSNEHLEQLFFCQRIYKFNVREELEKRNCKVKETPWTWKHDKVSSQKKQDRMASETNDMKKKDKMPFCDGDIYPSAMRYARKMGGHQCCDVMLASHGIAKKLARTRGCEGFPSLAVFPNST